ncbi:DUF3048 domain-containing protein [Patescibacteria group bacterium]|nr:DUF3048 domain-containing protein [Patescibacteria group bacterium]
MVIEKFKKNKFKIVTAAIIFLAIIYIGRNDFFRTNTFEFRNSANIPQGGANSKNDLNQKRENKNLAENPLTGERCENGNQRVIAVMLSSDEEVRPLSGIASADMVFEMPVVDNGATRLMAVFGCILPEEIGSVRSARDDFIPLARGLDAIYSHWGGSHFALDKLKTGIIDNIDALPNPFNAFYRKSGIPAPHNGFTSGEKLLNASEKLGYRMTNEFNGYPHLEAPNTKYQILNTKLIIGYPGEFAVEYKYDNATNSYFRWRGDKKEIDKNNNEQASAKNIVVMYAQAKQIEGQYNDVKIIGQGKAEFYFNGAKTDGVWKKDSEASKLFFLDNSGQEIKFTPGNIWVEIIQPERKAEWVNE